MGLRTYKSSLKQLKISDQEAIILAEAAIQDDLHLGVSGGSYLHDFAVDACVTARQIYLRAKRAEKNLIGRQKFAIKNH